MINKTKTAKQILKKYNQEHLLQFFDEITEEQQESLLNQILEIDFEELKTIFERGYKTEEQQKNSNFSPISVIDKAKLTDKDKEKLKESGINILKNNQYAVIALAGGQGTRLEHEGPKALYPLEFLNNKTLIQLQIEQVVNASKKYVCNIYLYIMTNFENKDIINDYLSINNYFGLNKDFVKFFIQDNIELLDKQGKVLLESKYNIYQVPNGNGGIYKSLEKSGMLKDMQQKKIKYIVTCNIDNILIDIIDPLFIGILEKEKTLIGCKTVIKAHEKERVGVFCNKENRPSIVEYIEVSDEMAKKKNENDEFIYGDSFLGHILFNIESFEKFEKVNTEYHRAIKKYSFINNEGKLEKSLEPNSYKYEKFIFDVFPLVNNISLLRVLREDEFAPIKNKTGEQSPETAKQLYLNKNNK